MSRHLVIAAAQMGPIARTQGRPAVVQRMIDLMREAKALGAQVVAYPEAALTAFFHTGSPRTRTKSTPGSSVTCRARRPSPCLTKPAA